ncbi:MAG: AMP-binding protein, partial [bacterium]|nr:AMP-binding protein [bacterium]
MTKKPLDTILNEDRTFSPSEEFSKAAHVSSFDAYKRMYEESIKDPQKFWASVAEEFRWYKKWDTVLDESDAPVYKWFSGGRTNLSDNCLDRHLQSATRNKAAIIWEGEPGEQRVLTYRDLWREVNMFANALKKTGVGKGDRVAIYLPMIPELAVAMLACARIGAVHTVIFAGFSAESIRDRVLDCEAKMVITADGGWRKGSVLPLKDIVDEAVADCACVESVIVVKRSTGPEPYPCSLKDGRDRWYHDVMDAAFSVCVPEQMESEDPLFLLYTSGTTGKPKGIVHTTAGYMVFAAFTARYVFDLKPEDVYWCTADIGWVTGHSYIVYGPLANGATCVMYEGAPNSPDEGRFWQLIEKYGVTIFYTAPTAIRAFMKWGEQWPQKYDLTSLRLLGSVGEPINPEAWMWYHNVIGGKRC